MITSREPDADFPIFEASDCSYIEFDAITVEGFKNPFVVTDNPEKIRFINSDKIDVRIIKMMSEII